MEIQQKNALLNKRSQLRTIVEETFGLVARRGLVKKWEAGAPCNKEANNEKRRSGHVPVGAGTLPQSLSTCKDVVNDAKN